MGPLPAASGDHRLHRSRRETHTIIGIPAERFLGNEDGRGGFGALQASGLYDPAHPPCFLLHSDGENFGGGIDSYYRHNTSRSARERIWMA